MIESFSKTSLNESDIQNFDRTLQCKFEATYDVNTVMRIIE